MTDIELLPCPFCGGCVFMHHGHNGIGYVTCGQRDDGSDGCGTVASFRPNKGGKDAITAWNRRANVAHHTAKLQAENEALRTEAAKRDGIDPWAVLIRAQEAEARAERLAEALQWYVDNDDTNDGEEGNEFWLAGRDRARALLRDHDQEARNG